MKGSTYDRAGLHSVFRDEALKSIGDEDEKMRQQNQSFPSTVNRFNQTTKNHGVPFRTHTKRYDMKLYFMKRNLIVVIFVCSTIHVRLYWQL